MHLGRLKGCCEVAINNVVFQDWSAGVDVPTVTFLPDIPKVSYKAGLKVSSALVLIRAKLCILRRITSRRNKRLLTISDGLVILKTRFCYRNVECIMCMLLQDREKEREKKKDRKQANNKENNLA